MKFHRGKHYSPGDQWAEGSGVAVTFMVSCLRCGGEGRKMLPPFEPLTLENIDTPFRWREAFPCKQCKGKGWSPATPEQIDKGKKQWNMIFGIE